MMLISEKDQLSTIQCKIIHLFCHHQLCTCCLSCRRKYV